MGLATVGGKGDSEALPLELPSHLGGQARSRGRAWQRGQPPGFPAEVGHTDAGPHSAAVQSWRSFTHSSGEWTASKIWTDASSFYPRDGALRVVGWACVAWLAGGWVFIRGTMPPGTTVAQGEARAIQVGLDRLEPGGVIASDCWAAVCLWLQLGANPTTEAPCGNFSKL